MSNHVLDDLADYIEGRLTPERLQEVEAHLASCSECAGDFAWAREFRTEALSQGYGHLRPGRIVEVADGVGEPPSDAERGHMERCTRCREEVSWAQSLPRMRGSEDIQIVRRAPRRARLWGLAGVTALAATLWLLFIPRDKPEIVTLAVIEPLPVRLNRGEADSGQFHEARIRGLELYAGADYAGARDALQRAVELEPDNDEVNLYLGSAELLVGNESRAQPPLRTAARTTASPQVREEALWQLANAHLAAGERSEAVSVLREVVSQDRRHREQAERLLGELEK